VTAYRSAPPASRLPPPAPWWRIARAWVDGTLRRLARRSAGRKERRLARLVRELDADIISAQSRGDVQWSRYRSLQIELSSLSTRELRAIQERLFGEETFLVHGELVENLARYLCAVPEAREQSSLAGILAAIDAREEAAE
jgi:hypothetical protein